MTLKTSKDVTLYGDRKGDDLNYELNYKPEKGFAHRYSQIGSRYYRYDEAGNITEEREAPFEQVDEGDYYKVEEIEEDVYGVNEAWGYFSDAGPEGSADRYDAKIYHRKFTWDEKNQLIRSTDNTVDVYFVYGEDGKRSHKYTWNTETLYFNNFWSYYKDGTTSFAGGKVSKHIFLGETRLATTINDYAYAVNDDHSTESDHIYYYHSDHLGSAQLVTDYRGDEYERLEYTPYGETWVNVKIQGDNERTPMSFRFSAKELDKETGFYYYGARYLDPKYSRWISADPAMNTGEYFPVAPIDDNAKRHNQNLPGMGGVFNHINGNCYHYAANNPIKYTDPDGRISGIQNTTIIMDDYSDIIGNQDERKRINLANGIDEKDIFFLRINGYGCVLTMFARLASTLAGFNIKPNELNDYCIENNLFTLDDRDQWGDITLLFIENGIKAVNGLLKEKGITNVELELAKIECLSTESYLQTLLNKYDNDPENVYLYGLRVDNSHSLTIIRDYTGFDPKHPREKNKKFKKVDTSPGGFSSVNYNNLTYLYVFKVKVVQNENE